MKISNIALSVFFSVFLILTGCGGHDEKLSADVVTSLRTTLNANEPEAAANLFTDDGALMPGFGTPIEGRKALKQYMERTLRKQLQFWINSENSTVSGDLAYDEGNYRIRNIRRDEDLGAGKYFNIYKRVNGEWKLYRSIFSPNSLSEEPTVLGATKE